MGSGRVFVMRVGRNSSAVEVGVDEFRRGVVICAMPLFLLLTLLGFSSLTLAATLRVTGVECWDGGEMARLFAADSRRSRGGSTRFCGVVSAMKQNHESVPRVYSIAKVGACRIRVGR